MYLLFDDWLYMEIGDRRGTYGRLEAREYLKQVKSGAQVAFLGYQTKRIVSQDLEESLFEDKFLFIKERVSSNEIQVIGVHENKIKEIHEYLKGIKIDSLVPYGVAVRGYLNQKGALNAHRFVIFVDDLGNQALITVFEGMFFSATRSINLKNTEYMVSEIKRSWQAFQAETNRNFENNYVIVCNNQSWLGEFVDHHLCLKHEALYISAPLAVIEGLKIAKFAIHFVLPEELIRDKRIKQWKQDLKIISISALMLMVSLASYFGMQGALEKKEDRYKLIQLERARLIEQISSLNQIKFSNLLKQRFNLDYAKIFFDFIQSIPKGYVFEHLGFKYDNKYDSWIVEAEIYPKNETENQRDFLYKGSFSEARVTPVIAQHSLGQEIYLVMNSDSEEI